MATKAWNKEKIQEILKASDKAVLKGLLRIYTLQTADEQAMEATTQHNSVGFSGYDGNFMTSLAKSLIKYGRLTPKQMVHARKKMLRYAGQLAKIANGEIACPPLPAIRGMKFASKPPVQVVQEVTLAVQGETQEDEKQIIQRGLEW